MIVLGIETSCDETAAAVLDVAVRGAAEGEPSDQTARAKPAEPSGYGKPASVSEPGAVSTYKVLSSIVASQDDVHAPYGGVVPELASRRHLEAILPVLHRALEDAGVDLRDVDGIAVTQGPGLVGSLLVGCSVGKAIAWAHRKPLVGVNHLEGHVYAAFLEADPPAFPFLALVVSGGHTALYLARDHGRYERIGQTRDDAAGEAFDKVAKLLGLGYPGGPIIERVAKAGNPKAIRFPTAQMSDRAPDFSFSGLKTAVSLHVKRAGRLSEDEIADVAASFQATVVKMLVRKTLQAAVRLGVKHLVLTGGVAANTALRTALGEECRGRDWDLHVPSRRLCTDNAAMIAAAGHDRLLAGERAPLTMNAVPDLALA